MKIRTQADIAELEKLPVGERLQHKNVFEIVRDSAAAHADRVAFRALSGTAPGDPARNITYGEMLRRVIQTANLLQASGVGPNDTVTLLLPGVPETSATGLPSRRASRTSKPEGIATRTQPSLITSTVRLARPVARSPGILIPSS